MPFVHVTEENKGSDHQMNQVVAAFIWMWVKLIASYATQAFGVFLLLLMSCAGVKEFIHLSWMRQ